MHADRIAEILQPTVHNMWLVTAADGERRGGLIATGVANASIVPDMPRVLAIIGRRHYTCELIEASGAFALHQFDETLLDWVWRFGLQSGRDVDKLAGLNFHPGAGGSPILTEAAAWLDCRVENRMETGDRTVYLAEVVDGDRRPGIQPLTMDRLLQLAPADKRQEMDSQRRADAALDAAAIRQWRTS